MVLSQATYLVSVGNNINSHASPVASPTISRTLLLMMSKADKLPMDTEPVACDNNLVTKLLSHLTQLIIIVIWSKIVNTCILVALLVEHC